MTHRTYAQRRLALFIFALCETILNAAAADRGEI
jgi:hypothetical protein